MWELRDSFFKHPQRIEQITIAVASHDEDVLAQKGELLRVSPVEITSAFILAVARDIRSKEPDECIQKWKHHMLNTNCDFLVLEDQWKRYWHALQSYEDIENINSAVFDRATNVCSR